MIFVQRGLPDKERLLLTLADQLCTTLLLRHGAHHQQGAYTDSMGGTYVHFEDRNPKPGDLVLVTHCSINRYTIGWYVEPLIGGGVHGGLIREFGSKAMCRLSNVAFKIIVGLDADDLLEGHARRMLEKIELATSRLYKRDWVTLFAGADIGPTRVCARWRKKWSERKPQHFVEFDWTPRMSAKKVEAALLAGGWGDESSHGADARATEIPQ